MDEKRDEGSFEQRLNDARDRQGLDEPAADEGPPQNAAGLGARVGVELVAALVVGLVIGYWLDRWLHTSPILLLLFFFLGMVAGIMNVWRLVSPRKPSAGRH